jgi:hypothetical protein
MKKEIPMNNLDHIVIGIISIILIIAFTYAAISDHLFKKCHICDKSKFWFMFKFYYIVDGAYDWTFYQAGCKKCSKKYKLTTKKQFFTLCQIRDTIIEGTKISGIDMEE